MINIQFDFSNYFDMVQDKATTSKFYTDIQKLFQEGKIDAKTFASIMIEYNASTLRESIETARSMSLGLKELELKNNESIARVATEEERKKLLTQQIVGFTDNLKVKAAASASGLYGAIQQGGLSAPSSVVNKALETLETLIIASKRNDEENLAQ